MTKELQLTDYEKGYLRSFYDHEALDSFKEFCFPYGSDYEENHWVGIQVGERMFDLCICWVDREITCVVYECDPITDEMGNENWMTNVSDGEWYLTEENTDELLEL